jgi:hypothetical protein
MLRRRTRQLIGNKALREGKYLFFPDAEVYTPILCRPDCASVQSTHLLRMAEASHREFFVVRLSIFFRGYGADSGCSNSRNPWYPPSPEFLDGRGRPALSQNPKLRRRASPGVRRGHPAGRPGPIRRLLSALRAWYAADSRRFPAWPRRRSGCKPWAAQFGWFERRARFARIGWHTFAGAGFIFFLARESVSNVHSAC